MRDVWQAVNVYRQPPPVLPSLADVDALEVALAPRYRAPLSFAMYQHLATTEPFAYAVPREERRARERAASAPCPAFVSGPPLGRWYIPPPPKGPSKFPPVSVPE